MNIEYDFDTTQVTDTYMKDEPGAADVGVGRPGWNILHGEWKFSKGGMDTFSNGFGNNQIRRYINRLKRVEKEMKKMKAQWENMNYNDYHFESDTYPDH